MNDFDNIVLCLFDGKLVGGLAFMANFMNTCYFLRIHKLDAF